MKISYDVNINDCLVFQRYVTKSSKTILRNIRRGQLLWSVSPLIGCMLVFLYRGCFTWYSFLLLGMVGILLSIPFFFLYPIYHRYYMKRNFKQLLNTAQLKGVLGTHELIIAQDGLIEITSANETRTPWDAIDNIITTSDYAYIFLSEILAYIIPKASILNGDYDRFIEEVSLRIKHK